MHAPAYSLLNLAYLLTCFLLHIILIFLYRSISFSTFFYTYHYRLLLYRLLIPYRFLLDSYMFSLIIPIVRFSLLQFFYYQLLLYSFIFSYSLSMIFMILILLYPYMSSISYCLYGYWYSGTKFVYYQLGLPFVHIIIFISTIQLHHLHTRLCLRPS